MIMFAHPSNPHFKDKENEADRLSNFSKASLTPAKQWGGFGPRQSGSGACATNESQTSEWKSAGKSVGGWQDQGVVQAEEQSPVNLCFNWLALNISSAYMAEWAL